MNKACPFPSRMLTQNIQKRQHLHGTPLPFCMHAKGKDAKAVVKCSTQTHMCEVEHTFVLTPCEELDASRDANVDVAGLDGGRHVGDGLQARAALPAGGGRECCAAGVWAVDSGG